MNARRRAAQLAREYAQPTASMARLICDRHDPARLAMRFVDEDDAVVEIDYRRLGEWSRVVASDLRARGVRPGDRVATLAGKSPHLAAILLGIWRTGAVYVPLFTAFSAPVVRDRLEEARVRVVIVDAANRDKVAGWSGGDVLVDEGDGTSTELPAVFRAADDGAPDHVTGGAGDIVHMFTSGTTGKPKAVVHPLAYAAGWQSYHEYGLGVRDDDVFWSAADPGWAYGLYTAIIAPLAAGHATTSIAGVFDPVRVWRVFERLGVTNFAAAPTAYRALRNAGRPADAGLRLRRLSSAGEPLTPEINAWAPGALGSLVHDHFGQTELGMVLGFPHESSLEVQDRAMGVALPGWEVAVVDEAGPVADGEVGQLAVSVDSRFMTFAGYHDVGRADRFSADGRWYLTGDLARRDPDGVVHFSSRADDVIIMAGYRIGPFDLESIIVTHDQVAECAVVAVPDDLRGEVIAAHVVLVRPEAGSDDLSEELRQLVRTGYGAHAVPRYVHYWPALPKTPSGKIRRAELRAAGAVR